jgi:hypothetical protein
VPLRPPVLSSRSGQVRSVSASSPADNTGGVK